MTADIATVYGLILIVAVLMASNKVRFDAIALMVVLALTLSGVLTVQQALSGFGNSVVILVAALLVIGDMLERTGVARLVGDQILKTGGDNQTYLLVLIMIGAAGLGAIMSSTAVVAIFIPIVIRIAAKTNANASGILLPMAYAALVSGMLTLIASPPNLVVSEELVSSGFAPLGFFSFTLVGLAVLLVLVIYMLLLGRRMLSASAGGKHQPQSNRARSVQELWKDFETNEVVRRIELRHGALLLGKSIAEAQIDTQYDVRILGIERRRRRKIEYLPTPESALVLLPRDSLRVCGTLASLERLVSEQKCTLTPTEASADPRWFWEVGGAEVMIHPDSHLIGSSLRTSSFRSAYNLHVLGIRRNSEPQPEYRDLKLQAADSLFVIGSWKNLRQMQRLTHEIIPLEISSEEAEVVPSYNKMPLALTILAGMVLLSILDVFPLVTNVLMAAMLGIACRCLSTEDAYRSIHWSSLVLIAGMLPLADALDQTGGTKLLVGNLLQAIGEAGPYIMLTIVFWLTALLGLILSNTASAVLIAPVAISMAEALSVSPYPFAIAVLIAASAAFATPVSTPVVTLVVEPGRYRFIDFVKLGVPMQLLTYLVTLLVAPIVFPF